MLFWRFVTQGRMLGWCRKFLKVGLGEKDGESVIKRIVVFRRNRIRLNNGMSSKRERGTRESE